MKKGKIALASFGLIGLFLIIPFAQAATSQIWPSAATEIYWKFTGEALDAGGAVTSTNVTYRKLNFTSIVDQPTYLEITSVIYDNTSAINDVADLDDPTIWADGGMSIGGDMEDADPMTKFMSLFNEINTDLTDINSIPAENQTLILMAMNVMIDPVFIAVFIVYILAMGFGGTFGHDINSTDINSINARKINYDLSLDFSLEDGGGHYDNISYNANVDLTYGKSSNVLLKGSTTSTLTAASWNGTAYEGDTLRLRYTHDIAAPSELLDDFPIIPGFSVWILLGAMVLGIIPVYIIIKRKKK